jgi:hypothetical protein
MRVGERRVVDLVEDGTRQALVVRVAPRSEGTYRRS